ANVDRESMELARLDGGGVDVEIEAAGAARAPLSSLGLFPAEVVERIRRARVLLAKATYLATALGLDAATLRVLTVGAPLTLPTASGPGATEATALFGRILTMIRFAHAKKVAPLDRLRVVLQAGTSGDLRDAVRAAFVRDASTAEALVGALGVSPRGTFTTAAERIADVDRLVRDVERLIAALALTRKLGVGVPEITSWVAGAVDWTMSRSVRDVIRAKYTESGWRTFAKPVFDELRKRQRDALVAYVLQKKGLSRVEELFESFLLDPATEPVVLTSRIQLAISSVQTFIQRSFLNLEEKVPAGILDAKRWDWMKRYRAWEANRKILLWPENWLEPEFRDDVTHLATGAFGALLEGDVTQDLVEKAFFDYVQGLEEIARLEIVSCFQEKKNDGASVLHVLGRTYTKSAKYFYRSFADNMWTPWVPVTANIDGDHVAVVKWRDRVHVFWVSLLEERASSPVTGLTPTEIAEKPTSEIAGLPTMRAQLSWVEWFKGKWVNQRSSGFLAPSARFTVGMTADVSTANGIRFTMTAIDGKGASLLLRNKNSNVEISSIASERSFPVRFREPLGLTATGFFGLLGLQASFADGQDMNADHTILTFAAETPPRIASVVPPVNVRELGKRPLDAPFFFQDHSHTFLVQPTAVQLLIPNWQGWIVTSPPPRLALPEVRPMRPQHPEPRVSPVYDPVPFETRDWLFDHDEAVRFGTGAIGGGIAGRGRPLTVRDGGRA
ncbi:MAG TPA: neuraminidase-like domain-containing protein, partial [Labilithrix sp.]|nr:neuraminidase-like domain-containing protein [Labilithrix sp.]